MKPRAVLQYDLALLKPKRGAIYEGDALMPPLTEEELMAKAREGMEASGGRVIQIEKISYKGWGLGLCGKGRFWNTSRESLFETERAGEPSVISVMIPFLSIPLILRER